MPIGRDLFITFGTIIAFHLAKSMPIKRHSISLDMELDTTPPSCYTDRVDLGGQLLYVLLYQWVLYMARNKAADNQINAYKIDDCEVSLLPADPGINNVVDPSITLTFEGKSMTNGPFVMSFGITLAKLREIQAQLAVALAIHPRPKV
jgi:hypothetical protein